MIKLIVRNKVLLLLLFSSTLFYVIIWFLSRSELKSILESTSSIEFIYLYNIASDKSYFEFFQYNNSFSIFLFFFKKYRSKFRKKCYILFFNLFFIYIGNWEWCFWKLADVYFLFNFSLVFYFTYQTLQKKNTLLFIFFILFYACIINKTSRSSLYTFRFDVIFNFL